MCIVSVHLGRSRRQPSVSMFQYPYPYNARAHVSGCAGRVIHTAEGSGRWLCRRTADKPREAVVKAFHKRGREWENRWARLGTVIALLPKHIYGTPEAGCRHPFTIRGRRASAAAHPRRKVTSRSVNTGPVSVRQRSEERPVLVLNVIRHSSYYQPLDP